MNATEQINAFIAHIKTFNKSFTESRSSLKKLLVYLRIPANSEKRFMSVQEIKMKCANPKDKRLDKYEPALNELKKVWGTSLNYGRPVSVALPPPPLVTPSNAMILVNEVRAELEKCKLYACNDVGTFSSCVNKSLPKSEQDRIRKAKPEFVGAPILSPDRSWKARSLKVAFDSVNSKQAAECTNFAYYAAHILGTGKTTPQPRIEIVSWEGEGTLKHLFVLVGRKGTTAADGRIPSASTWNNDVVIVDCWALSLGWDCVFTKDNYCFKGMMSPLKVQMDSTIASLAGPMNVQGGLKKTGFDLTK